MVAEPSQHQIKLVPTLLAYRWHRDIHQVTLAVISLLQSSRFSTRCSLPRIVDFADPTSPARVRFTSSLGEISVRLGLVDQVASGGTVIADRNKDCASANLRERKLLDRRLKRHLSRSPAFYLLLCLRILQNIKLTYNGLCTSPQKSISLSSNGNHEVLEQLISPRGLATRIA